MSIADTSQLYGLISKAIITTLKRQDVDDESIFTFSLCLELTVFKAYSPRVADSRRLTKALLENNLMEREEYTDTLFQKNEIALIHIYKAIWLNASQQKDIRLLERKCKQLFRKNASIEVCVAILRILMDSFTMDANKFYLSIRLIDQLFQRVVRDRQKKGGKKKGAFHPDDCFLLHGLRS